MKVCVIGCGRWGSLITWYLSEKKGLDVTLYGRESSEAMQRFISERRNDLLTLPESVKLSTSIECARDSDVIIISIGLAIGAIFVRSLTILLVEKKTLKQFLYLEHGAHWAIGVLASLMFVSTFQHVPEVITGLLGLAFIISALISSIIHNKKEN